jgi:hypothetical protein
MMVTYPTLKIPFTKFVKISTAKIHMERLLMLYFKNTGGIYWLILSYLPTMHWTLRMNYAAERLEGPIRIREALIQTSARKLVILNVFLICLSLFGQIKNRLVLKLGCGLFFPYFSNSCFVGYPIFQHYTF